jgi:uncharacterized protein (TIGR03118 family)
MKYHQFRSGRSLAFRYSAGLAFVLALSVPALAGDVTVTNLVTNNQAVNPAPITDPNLVNPWGVSFSSTSPLWVSDNGTNVSTLYSITPSDKVSEVTNPTLFPVNVPGGPTGQVNNGSTTAFNGDPFVFVTLGGAVDGWRPALGNTASDSFQAASSANSYTGATLVTVNGDSYLLAANNKTGNIDVIPGTAGQPPLTGNFKDPNLPTGATPYNVQVLNGVVYVTYNQGFVDAFSTSGVFMARVGSGGSLDNPWGLAIAPTSFGNLAGDLLVGNLNSGQISVFNLSTDTAAGVLTGTNGAPIVIQDLWALYVGNNAATGSGSNQQVYFTAGSNGYADGLLGAIQSVPEPSSAVLGLIAVGALAGRWHWKNRRRAAVTS